MAHVLTADEWDALPDTSGLELIDGVVHAVPSPTLRHERVKARLRNCLEDLLPPELGVSTEIEVRISHTHRRRPDVLVFLVSGVNDDTWAFEPGQVVFAAEIVSPGSETIDRKHKPIEYADAGILHYWRVETKPVVGVHTSRLGETGGYVETGLFRQGDRISDPTLRWASFDVGDLLP